MQDNLKKQAAEAAIPHIKNCRILGVGTGSTVNHFIDLLAPLKHQFEGAVSSSEASTERLLKLGIPVLDLNAVGTLDVYIDGADEINSNLELIKGGGGALTREKIVAAASEKFVCIADDSKLVDVLGTFPLPVEVIPMARSYVAREIVKLGGQPVLREGFTTDNGNVILDINNMSIIDPVDLETKIDLITGVVTNGLFARRGANVFLMATSNGVVVLEA